MPSQTTVRLRLADSDTTAKWHLLFPLGATKHRADFPKPITFSAPFLQTMERNYATEGKPERAVNFFHQGASDVPAPIDNKVAAGWIVDVQFRDGLGDDAGLYALIQWTERARAYILKDELRYLSPEFVTQSTDKDTGAQVGPKLLGAALLNDPFLTELPRVAASEAQGASDMNRKLVCQAVGCPESATDEEINAACKKMAEDAAAAKKAEAEAAAAAEAEAAQKAEVEKKAAAEKEAQAIALAESEKQKLSLADRVTALEKENAILLAERKAAEVKAFFDKSIAEGRCTPALREGLEPLALAHGLEAVKFLEKAAMVPMGEMGITGAVEPETPVAATKQLSEVAAKLEKEQGLKGTDAMRLAVRTNKTLADKAALTK